MKKLFKNKWVWVIVGILAAAGFVIWGSSESLFAEETTEGQEVTAAFIGDLAESATASGEVVAEMQVGLSLLTSGVVETINVAVGDEVKAGDVLVELESAELQRSVESAESALRVAEAELAELLAGPSKAELAAVETAAASAKASLDDLLAGPTEAEIAASEASVNAAQANIWSSSGSLSADLETSDADIYSTENNLQRALEDLQSADEAWIRAADCEEDSEGNVTCVPSDDDGMAQASLDVEMARAEVALAEAQLAEAQNPDASTVASSQASVASSQASYDAAVARHEALLAGATEEEIASAEADLASAQADLEILLAGALATEVETYETRVEQSKTDLADAQYALSKTTLVAPSDGVATALHVAEGETASGLAVELVDVTSLEVVLNVDEIDIGELSIGQEAIVTLETWPDVEIASEVTAIAPSAGSSNGVVSFDVYLSLADSDLPILVGMTANADLITANTEDVLLVPNAALTSDRDSGRYYIEMMGVDDTVEQIEVTIGLRDSEYTQITSGLNEGDQVLMGTITAPIEEGGFGPGR